MNEMRPLQRQVRNIDKALRRIRRSYHDDRMTQLASQLDKQSDVDRLQKLTGLPACFLALALAFARSGLGTLSLTGWTKRKHEAMLHSAQRKEGWGQCSSITLKKRGNGWRLPTNSAMMRTMGKMAREDMYNTVRALIHTSKRKSTPSWSAPGEAFLMALAPSYTASSAK